MAIKLWYQSVTREGRFPAYTRLLRRVIDRAKDPETEVEVHGITRAGGIGDQYRYLAFLQSVEILENVHRAIEEGFDAFLIGNIGDPGLREAREIADFPVLGLGSTAMAVMRTMGESFGLVTINEKFRPRLNDMMRQTDTLDRLVGLYPMDIPLIVDLERACGDADAGAELLRRFEAAADRASRDGSEVILAAGGVVVALVEELGFHRTADGTPVLNAIAALIKQAEAAVCLSRLMDGGYTSKRLTYAAPGSAEIGTYREAYGARVYPRARPTDSGDRD